MGKNTEGTLQAALFYRWGMGREFSMPNYTYFCNESDFLTVTKNGYVDEYEIKISRSDYRADQKKERWELYKTRPHLRRGTTFSYSQYPHTTVFYRRYPNRFWYVTPEGLITPDELPEYAGLITRNERDILTIERQAPKLHANKAPPGLIIDMRARAANRYIYDAMAQRARA